MVDSSLGRIFSVVAFAFYDPPKGGLVIIKESEPRVVFVTDQFAKYARLDDGVADKSSWAAVSFGLKYTNAWYGFVVAGPKESSKKLV